MSITLNDIFTRAADRLTGSNTSCVNPISRVNDRLPPNRFEHLHRQLLVVPFDRRLLARGTGIPTLSRILVSPRSSPKQTLHWSMNCSGTCVGYAFNRYGKISAHRDRNGGCQWIAQCRPHRSRDIMMCSVKKETPKSSVSRTQVEPGLICPSGTCSACRAASKILPRAAIRGTAHMSRCIAACTIRPPALGCRGNLHRRRVHLPPDSHVKC